MIERSQVRVPAGGAGEFFSPGSAFCAISYFGMSFNPVLPQYHVKDPGLSAKTAKHAFSLRLWLNCMKVA